MAERRAEGEPSPALVQQIENNLLLKQALDEIKQVRITTTANHQVIANLIEHKTIDRVDTLWVTMGQLTFLARLTVGALAMIVAGVPILLVTHTVWRWP